MTSNEPPEAKAERLAEERAEEEYHVRRHREKCRAPKSPALLPLSKRPKSGKMRTFHITCEVPEEYWNALVKEGFKENDLPDMLAGSIRDISDQVGHVAPESREMSF